jgi:hypothetical protein
MASPSFTMVHSSSKELGVWVTNILYHRSFFYRVRGLIKLYNDRPLWFILYADEWNFNNALCNHKKFDMWNHFLTNCSIIWLLGHARRAKVSSWFDASSAVIFLPLYSSLPFQLGLAAGDAYDSPWRRRSIGPCSWQTRDQNHALQNWPFAGASGPLVMGLWSSRPALILPQSSYFSSGLIIIQIGP